MLSNIFFNPFLPNMDDYYEPWTYKYEHLFTAPQADDQPTARAISKVTGKYIDVEAGPNWDDDLGGSPVYAENDKNLDGLTPDQREEAYGHLVRVAVCYGVGAADSQEHTRRVRHAWRSASRYL